MTRRRQTAASLTLTGTPGLTAPATDEQPGVTPAERLKKFLAEKDAAVQLQAEQELESGDDPFAAVPDLPARRTARSKAFFYIRADLKEQADRIARYAQYQLGMTKGEVQDVILTVGLSEPMEVLRALRERSAT